MRIVLIWWWWCTMCKGQVYVRRSARFLLLTTSVFSGISPVISLISLLIGEKEIDDLF
jgi:hypothetical protein